MREELTYRCERYCMYRQRKKTYLVALVGEANQAEAVAPDGHVGVGSLALHYEVSSGDFFICGTRDDGLVGRWVDSLLQEDGQPLCLQHKSVRSILRWRGGSQRTKSVALVIIPPGPAISGTTSSGQPDGIRRPNFVHVCVSDPFARTSSGQKVVVDMFVGLKIRSVAKSI